MIKLTEIQKRKFKITYQTICAINPLYQSSNNSKERDIYETIIGACLWYIKSRGWKSELISEKALYGVKKKVYDHRYPRKDAAKHYLQKSDLSLEYLIDTFTSKYGITNVITSKENKDLQNARKDGVPIEKLYDSCNIKLIKKPRNLKQFSNP